MEIKELLELCKTTDVITLVLSNRPSPRGHSIHLLPNRRGPTGMIMNVNRRGDIVARFLTSKILKYLGQNGC
jgi:hypothetical protein